MSNDWPKVAILHDQQTNTTYMHTEKKNVLPKYMQYMVQYLKLPSNTKTFFKDDLNIPMHFLAAIKNLDKPTPEPKEY